MSVVRKTDMGTLSDFLLARIAEDEEFARGALSMASVYTKPVKWHWLRTDGNGSAWEPTNHSPARVLAECEAKRRIVEEHPEDFATTLARDYPNLEPNDGSGDWVSLSICGRCSNVEQTGLETEYIRLPCPTLRLLALPYADHPDYREEWRP